MGEVAPQAKLRLFLRVAAVVLVLDVLSKVLAALCLEEGVDHWIGQVLSLHLRFNESGFGSDMHRVIRQFGAPAILLTGVGLFLGLLVPLVYSRATHAPVWKAASLLGVPLTTSVIACVAGLAASVVLPHPDVSLEAISLVRIPTALTFWWLCLRLTRNKYLFGAASVQLAAALGNIGSGLVHPRGTVDFLWVPAFSPHLGVFNLADVAIELSRGLFLAYPLVAVFAYAPGFATTWNKLVWPIEASVN